LKLGGESIAADLYIDTILVRGWDISVWAECGTVSHGDYK
jgi:hypothetical protein